jgi:hypothetical protein
MPHTRCRKENESTRSAVTHVRTHDRQYFRRVVEHLKQLLPPNRPVFVLTGRHLPRKDGDCSIVGRKFRIRISRELGLSQAVDVLLHEWAHALSWDACVGKTANSRKVSDYEFERLAHGPKWGVAYSKVYLCFLYDIEPCVLAESLNAMVLARGGTK